MNDGMPCNKCFVVLLAITESQFELTMVTWVEFSLRIWAKKSMVRLSIVR